MTWVKLDTGFFSDPKILGVSHTARLLYIAGLCHSGDQLSDGVIQATAIPLLHFQAGSTDDIIDSLVASNLWEHHVDGYEIVNYLEHQQSRQQVSHRRKKDAARQAAKTAKDKAKQATHAVTHAVTPHRLHATDIDIDTDIDKTKPILCNEVAPLALEPAPPKENRFNEFWDVFSKKIQKQPALKSWAKHVVKAKVDQQSVIEAARTYVRWCRATDTFQANAATWLNQKRWEDELFATSSSPAAEQQSWVEYQASRPSDEDVERVMNEIEERVRKEAGQ